MYIFYTVMDSKSLIGKRIKRRIILLKLSRAPEDGVAWKIIRLFQKRNEFTSYGETIHESDYTRIVEATGMKRSLTLHPDYDKICDLIEKEVPDVRSHIVRRGPRPNNPKDNTISESSANAIISRKTFKYYFGVNRNATLEWQTVVRKRTRLWSSVVWRVRYD